MDTLRLKPHQLFLLTTFLLGCLPGLVLLIGFRIQNGELMMLGQSLGSYDLARILAAVLSPSGPLILLLPLALATLPPRVRGAFIGPALLAPVMFTLPTVMASFLIGARGLIPIVEAFALLALFNFNFCLWFRALKQVFPIYIAILLYGTFWASSGFLDYVARYVAPHQDFIGLKAAALLNWLLPQLGTASSVVDELLTGGAWHWHAILPTLIQLPLLIGLSLILPVREQDPIRSI